MIGAVFGSKFLIQEELDQNPVFKIYKAEDRTTAQEVRLRIIQSNLRSEKEFLKEIESVIETTRKVRHPGLATVVDVGYDDGIFYVATDYVKGVPLSERLKRLTNLSVANSVDLTIKIAEAVSALHANGQVHGDISSHNILTTSGDGVRVMMGGLYTAYRFAPQTGVAMLSRMAPYLAPEIHQGEMPNVRSDIYAIGVTMYQMISGQLPYDGATPTDVATKHAKQPYPSLRRSNPSIPQALDEVVRKAMGKDPEDRYVDINAFLRDLKKLQDALRFGKSLAWPLTEEEGEVETESITPIPEDVKPKLKRKPKPKGRPAESFGVPSWLAATVYVTTALTVVAIGGWVYFNLKKPKLVEVPNVIGKTFSEARMELDDLNLKLRQNKQEASERYPEGTILELNPPPGRSVRAFAFVDATVSVGSRSVEVPDLRGRTIGDVRNMLESVNLQMDERIEYVRNPDIARGLVIDQSPDPRTTVERFSRIRVTVSNGNERVQPTTRSRDTYIYTLNIRIPRSGEDSVFVSVEMTDDDGTTTIYDGDAMPGEVVQVDAEAVGLEATFRIYFNGQLVRQVTERAPVDPPG